MQKISRQSEHLSLKMPIAPAFVLCQRTLRLKPQSFHVHYAKQAYKAQDWATNINHLFRPQEARREAGCEHPYSLVG